MIVLRFLSVVKALLHILVRESKVKICHPVKLNFILAHFKLDSKMPCVYQTLTNIALKAHCFPKENQNHINCLKEGLAKGTDTVLALTSIEGQAYLTDKQTAKMKIKGELRKNKQINTSSIQAVY